MALMRKSNLFIAIILLIGIVLGSFLIYISNQQQKISVYDPESYGPFGFKALHLLLNKYQYRITKVPEFPELPKQEILMVITSDFTIFSDKERILKWVKSGGIVVELAQAKPKIVQNKFRMIADFTQKSIHSNHPGFDHLNYQIKNSRLYGVLKPQTGFYSVNHRYFIFTQDYGQGKIVTWSDLDGLVNKSLEKSPDNAVILIMLLKLLKPSATVGLIDWRYPNIPITGLSFPDIFNRYALASLLLLMGIIITVWKLSARFGRPLPLTLSKGRSYDEFVISLAGLFQRAESHGIVLDNLRQELLRVITQITGLTPQATYQEHISRLAEITGKNHQDLGELFDFIDKIPKTKISKQTFFNTAVKLDTYRKELLEWKKSTYSSRK